MTFWDVLVVAAKRWYITLAGILLTALALSWVSDAAPVYYAQVRVVMLAPEVALPNAYQRTLASLVDFTGSVARAMQGSGGAATVSEGVTLVGEGRQEGYSVRQPNSGGQWQYSFDDPYLDVQAVGTTADAAEKEIALAVDRIEKTVEDLQVAQGVNSQMMIRTQLAPPVPQVYQQDGSRMRSLAVTAVIGAVLTFFALLRVGPPRRRDALASGARAPEPLENNPSRLPVS